MQAQLIALDWGTTSLRAYKLGAAGAVLDQRGLSYGIMALPEAPRIIHGQRCEDRFELAFDEACGDWLDAQPGIPVIACGMVGSAQGWQEVPYCPTPTQVNGLSSQLQRLRSRRGADVYLVPGVIQHSQLPNVMRGEETQVLGVLEDLPPERRDAPLLIGLPGTHSKWVQVVEGRIQHFDTFMTGEVYGLLCAHSILGRTQQRSERFDQQAFDCGVQVALSAAGDLGVLSNLFSARTLGLTGQLSGAEQGDYLSGLMIGHELRAVAQVQRRQSSTTDLPDVVLIGSDALCQRYQRALADVGFSAVSRAPHATERGLWSLACAAGLVTTQSKDLQHA
jgi:2-dehydro-3-deoxygalactonokinase